MQENIQDIMRYESDIWSVADLLIAASVKQSDFPAYMMPFFAVMMLEGRMRNAAKAVEVEFGMCIGNGTRLVSHRLTMCDKNFPQAVLLGIVFVD